MIVVFRIARHLVKTSVMAQAQYRVDFLLQLVLAFFWVAWNVAPLWMIFEIRPTVAGWTFPEAMLVMSAFLVLKALLEGVITPSLNALVESVRNGKFDFVLIKPADAQLMISLARLSPAKVVHLSAGLALTAWSMWQLEPSPSALGIFSFFLLLAAGALGLYSVSMVLAATCFWFVKIDNLSFLFNSLFDAARWPIGVFRGWVRVILTFVVPIAVMTSFPAMAVLDRLALDEAALALASASLLFAASRLVLAFALSHYSSASS